MFYKAILAVCIIGIITFSFHENSHISKAESKSSEKGTIFEAEDAILSDGLTIENSEPGYSGTGYVGDFSEPDQSITFTIDVPADSLYDLSVGYGALYGDGKVANILLNDEPLGSITMGSGFGETSGGKILLNEGTNTVTITPNWTFFAIDYIKISPISAPPKHEVEKELINPLATEETTALFSYLVDNFGKNTLSGQQGDPNDDLADIKYIEELTGKLPAIIGLDLMDYSPSRVEYGASTDDVERGIEWHEQGGIVAFSWHWNAPKDLLNTDEHPWWSGFYTDATTFDVEYAMSHPESEDYKLLLRDIDAIAEELKKLQEAGVPVLWRPLHEAEGGWFWWGAKGPEPVIELWKLMYDRLTNDHQLNNLIWVWNSIDEDWYPGNDYVDIVSFDSYPGEQNYVPQSAQYEALVELSDNKKLIAMAENGPIPDPDLLSTYHSNYLYFTTWNGLLDEQNSDDHIMYVYNHDSVITRDDLPDFNGDSEPNPNEDGALDQLETLVDEAKGFEADDYTEETFASLTSAVEVAEELLVSENITKEQVDDTLKSLQKAINDLNKVEESSSEPDPNEDGALDQLETLVDEAKGFEADDYTEETFASLTSAIEVAAELLVSENITKEQVDDTLKSLQKAVNNLKKVEKSPSEPDPNEDGALDQLKKLVAEVKGFEADNYTEETFASLTEAIEVAEELLVNENITKEQVDEALENLQLAVVELIQIEEETEVTTEESRESDQDIGGLNNGSEDTEGNKLPSTATDSYNWILAGFIILILGSILLFVRKRKAH